MQRMLFICDHCGKEIDEMRSYTDMEIDDFTEWFRTDLCAKCYHELGDIVLQYCNKQSNK